MLISLFAWTYLTALCLIWGHLFLHLIMSPSEKSNTARLHPCLVCFAGLTAITSISLGLSLVTPLDLTVHMLFLICALLWLLRKETRRDIWMLLCRFFENYSLLQFGLLAACIAMILLISIHTTIHPDTLTYHAKSILLFQRYPPITGIANLRAQLGFQSGWFAALALMNPIRQLYNIVFLNGAVLSWFLIFLVNTLRRSWTGLLLLAYVLVSWTQVRNTAASPSPDFIVSLYCWAAILTFLDNDPANRNSRLSLTIIFCVGTVLTKVSGMMILLLAIPVVTGRLAKTWRLIIWSLVTFAILGVKNLIASGYVLYPSSWPDLFHVRWKVPLMKMQHLTGYISFCATTPHADPVMAKTFTFAQKIRQWWGYIDLSNHLLLITIAAGILVWLGLMIVKHDSSMLPGRYKFPLLVVLAGGAFWVFSAPDPRFGTGFLVPLAYFLWSPIPWSKLPAVRSRLIYPATLCFIIAISAYSVYRITHFMTSSNLILPSGIAHEAYVPIGCEDTKVDLLRDTIISDRNLYSDCSSYGFSSFRPVGVSIRQGFEPAPPSP